MNYLQIEMDSQTQKTNVWLPKKNGWGGTNQEYKINRYTTSKIDKQQGFMQSTGNNIQSH